MTKQSNNVNVVVPLMPKEFFLELERPKKKEPTPLRSNEEKMLYAKKNIGVRPGYEPCADHSILLSEGYIDEAAYLRTWIGGKVTVNRNPQRRLKLW